MRSRLTLALIATLFLPSRWAAPYSERERPVISRRAEQGKVGLIVARGGVTVRVIRILPGTPAARAGLQVDDEIVRVDGRSIQGLSLGDVVSLIAGPPGTPVVLGVRRQGAEIELTVTRARLGRLFNDAVRDRAVARFVASLIQRQGGAAAVRALDAVRLRGRAGDRTIEREASRTGYRFGSCRAQGSSTVGGFDGRRAWGRLPTHAPARPLAEELLGGPYALLPNLQVIDFSDPGNRLRDRGTVELRRPDWVPFALPRRARRLEFEGRSYDFDPARGELVRLVGRETIYFGGYRTLSKIRVPGYWAMDRRVYSVEVSFAAVDARRFRPVDRPVCGGPDRSFR